MKKQWFAPQVTEISVKMTEKQMKGGGGGDSLLPEQLDPWQECKCCS